MAHTTQEWVAAVAKIRGYVKKYLGQKSLNAKQQAALQTDLATLDKDLAALAVSLQAGALSSDPTVAGPQILASVGHPVRVVDQGDGPRLVTDDAASILADCSSVQNRELALLGYFGKPGETQLTGVDFSLWETYYEFADGGARPKDPAQAIWATYLASK